MRIEAAVVDFLRRDAGVLGLTGQGKRLCKGRPLPDEKQWPRLHYWLVSENNEYSLGNNDTGQPKAVFRFEALGRGHSGYEDARALADAVANAKAGGTRRLKEWAASWLPPTAAGRVWVQAVRVEELQAGEEEQPAAGGSKSIFVVAQDVTVWYVAQ